MIVKLWQAFLVLLVVRQSIVAWVNYILGTYRKGAVGKKGDKILAGTTNLTTKSSDYKLVDYKLVDYKLVDYQLVDYKLVD